MSIFNNSIRYLINSILPPAHRLTPVIDLLEAYLQPLQEYFNSFAAIDADQRKRARFSGQIIVMRAAVEYLTSRTGVTITINRRPSNGFFYLKSEISEQKQHLHLESEADPYYFFLPSVEDAAFSFVIGIPAPLTQQIKDKVRAEVDNFGLPIQNYTIEEI